MAKTTIEVEKETRNRLRVYKAPGGLTYDEAINQLLDAEGGVSPGQGREPPTEYKTLLSVAEGESVEVVVDDFENTRFPRDENPRTIFGEVKHIQEEVGRGAGEIQRCVVIGDPRGDGCIVDCGDTGDNKMTGGGRRSHKYLTAWRPRPGKDRLLLGRVTSVERSENDD